MIEKRPGQTFAASLTDAPSGLAGTLGVRIEGADGVEHTARTTAGIVEVVPGSGIYSKDDLVAPGDPGDYLVIWDTGGGTPVYGAEELVVSNVGTAIPALTGYPSTAELVAASSNDSLEALTEPEQDALRAAAIRAVEAFCRQTFVAEGTELDPVMRSLDGSGADRLYLPKRLAVLTDLSIDGAIWNVDSDVVLAEDGTHIAMVSPAVSGSWVTNVRRRVGDPGPIFYSGAHNVIVGGVWGWTDDEWEAGTLAPVATAIRFDMEDQAEGDANALASTIRSYRNLGVEAIEQGGLSAALRPGESTISRRAQRELIGGPVNLRWTPAYGAVV